VWEMRLVDGWVQNHLWRCMNAAMMNEWRLRTPIRNDLRRRTVAFEMHPEASSNDLFYARVFHNEDACKKVGGSLTMRQTKPKDALKNLSLKTAHRQTVGVCVCVYISVRKIHKGKTSPKKSNVAPDIIRRGNKMPP